MPAPSFTLVRGWRVALLLAAGALSPQRGAAECGNHVTVLNPTTESRHGPQQIPATSGEPVKVPCNGPNCSGAPDRHVPPPASTAPTGGQVKELVPGAGALDRDDPRHVRFDGAGRDARPIHRPLSIFIPPRTA